EEFGQAMYQMSVVVDDIDMRITHVIRGADHISNTPKQVLLYRAMGAAIPVFAHLPLILGADKSRLSKRHGATDVNMYRTEGFLPEAFRNFLALLGWSPGGDEEFLRTKELIEKFSLEGVSRTNAVFDRPKLEWFNTQYLQRLPIDELLSEVENELKRSGLWKPEWAAGAAPGPDGRDHAWFSKTGDLLRPRICLLPDFSSWWCAVCVTRLPRLRKYRTTFRDQVFQRRMFLAENPSSGPRLLVIVCQKSPCGRGWLRMLKQRCSAPHRV